MHRPPRQLDRITGSIWRQAILGFYKFEHTPAWAGVAGYLAVGITNSAPLAMVSGQRCITLFCLV